MELKEYVCQTIVQICQGVKEAQKECAEMGAIVNPAAFVYKDGDCYIPTKLNQAGVERRVQLIEIDAMLTESSSDTGGGHLGLGVSFMGVKIGGEQSTGNSSTNHVHFSVPVALPSVEVEDKSMPTPLSRVLG